jgi:hypothetical protein
MDEAVKALQVGDRFRRPGWGDSATARVMAIADGYVMARRPHAMPFVVSVKEAEAGKVPPVDTSAVSQRLTGGRE